MPLVEYSGISSGSKIIRPRQTEDYGVPVTVVDSNVTTKPSNKYKELKRKTEDLKNVLKISKLIISAKRQGYTEREQIIDFCEHYSNFETENIKQVYNFKESNND